MRAGGFFLVSGLVLGVLAPAQAQAPDYSIGPGQPAAPSGEPWRTSLPLGFSTSEQAPVADLEDAANLGVVGAMVELAARFRLQPDKARPWLIKASEGGSVLAKFELARSYAAAGAQHDAAEARRLDAEVYRLAMSGQRRDLPYWVFDKPLEAPPDAAPSARAATPPDGADPAALRADAEAGNVDAMRRLGLIYERGAPVWDVAPDQGEAIRWRTLAADAGDMDSLLVLAGWRRDGYPLTPSGVRPRRGPADPAAALALYQRAALAGSTQAMLSLAAMHVDGFGGVPRDPRLAEQWARRAFDAGDLQAGLQLGMWMRDGRLGRTVEGAELVPVLRKVAEGPDLDARARSAAAILATMYANGLDVRVDKAEEARWQARVDALLAEKKAKDRAAQEAAWQQETLWLRERARFWEAAP